MDFKNPPDLKTPECRSHKTFTDRQQFETCKYCGGHVCRPPRWLQKFFTLISTENMCLQISKWHLDGAIRLRSDFCRVSRKRKTPELLLWKNTNVDFWLGLFCLTSWNLPLIKYYSTVPFCAKVSLFDRIFFVYYFL